MSGFAEKVILLICVLLVLPGITEARKMDGDLKWVEKEGIRAIGVRLDNLLHWGADYGGKKVDDPYPWIDKYFKQLKEGGFNVLFIGQLGATYPSETPGGDYAFKNPDKLKLWAYAVDKAHELGFHVWQMTQYYHPNYYKYLKHFQKDRYTYGVLSDGKTADWFNSPYPSDVDEVYWKEIFIPYLKELAELLKAHHVEGMVFEMETMGAGHSMRAGYRMTCFNDRSFAGFMKSKNINLSEKDISPSLRFAWLKQNNLLLEYCKYLETSLLGLIQEMKRETRTVDPELYYVVMEDYWNPPAGQWFHWWGDGWLKGLDEKNRPVVLVDTGSTRSSILDERRTKRSLTQDIARFKHMGINPFYTGLIFAEARNKLAPADMKEVFTSYFKSTYGCCYFGYFSGPVFMLLPEYPNYTAAKNTQQDFDLTLAGGDMTKFWKAMVEANKEADALVKNGDIRKTREEARKKAEQIPAKDVINLYSAQGQEPVSYSTEESVAFGDDFSSKGAWATSGKAQFNVKGNLGYLTTTGDGSDNLAYHFSPPIDIRKYPFLELRVNFKNVKEPGWCMVLINSENCEAVKMGPAKTGDRTLDRYLGEDDWYTYKFNLNNLVTGNEITTIQIYPSSQECTLILDDLKIYHPAESEFVMSEMKELRKNLLVHKVLGRARDGMDMVAGLYTQERLAEKMQALLNLHLYDAKSLAARKGDEEKIYGKGIPVKLDLLFRGHHTIIKPVKIQPEFNWKTSCYLLVNGSNKVSCVDYEPALDKKEFLCHEKAEGMLWFEKAELKPDDKVSLCVENYVKAGIADYTPKGPVVLEFGSR